MKRAILALLLFALLPIKAQGFEFITSATRLYHSCQGAGETSEPCARNIAKAYKSVSRQHDMSETMNLALPFCAPTPIVPGDELNRIVIEWMKQNPESGYWSASSLVKRALEDKFPCTQTRP